MLKACDNRERLFLAPLQQTTWTAPHITSLLMLDWSPVTPRFSIREWFVPAAWYCGERMGHLKQIRACVVEQSSPLPQSESGGSSPPIARAFGLCPALLCMLL